MLFEGVTNLVQVLKDADRETLEQVTMDFEAWYDLTEGWRDNEGYKLYVENPALCEKADVVFDAILLLLRKSLSLKEV